MRCRGIFLLMMGCGLLMAADEGKQRGEKAYLKGMRALSEKRIPMNRAVVARCSIDGILNGSPHATADMVIHGNGVVIEYVRKHPGGIGFPIGSVLLKEKFSPGQKDADAILITRMARTGNKGVVGDWVFSARAVGGGEAEGSAPELAKCATCHEDFEDTGFVSEKTVGLLRAFTGRAK
jgi:hypothetical protein